MFIDLVRLLMHRNIGSISVGRGMDGGQAASNNSRRSQSPTTQALDSHFRTTMNGMATSVDVACDSLRELADEVLQRLTGNLGDNERKLVGQLQVKMFQESGKKADNTTVLRILQEDAASPVTFDLC